MGLKPAYPLHARRLFGEHIGIVDDRAGQAAQLAETTPLRIYLLVERLLLPADIVKPVDRHGHPTRRRHGLTASGDDFLEDVQQSQQIAGWIAGRQQAELLGAEEGAASVSTPVVQGVAAGAKLGLQLAVLVAQQLEAMGPNQVIIGHDAHGQRKDLTKGLAVV